MEGALLWPTRRGEPGDLRHRSPSRATQTKTSSIHHPAHAPHAPLWPSPVLLNALPELLSEGHPLRTIQIRTTLIPMQSPLHRPRPLLPLDDQPVNQAHQLAIQSTQGHVAPEMDQEIPAVDYIHHKTTMTTTTLKTSNRLALLETANARQPSHPHLITATMIDQTTQYRRPLYVPASCTTSLKSKMLPAYGNAFDCKQVRVHLLDVVRH